MYELQAMQLAVRHNDRHSKSGQAALDIKPFYSEASFDVALSLSPGVGSGVVSADVNKCIRNPNPNNTSPPFQPLSLLMNAMSTRFCTMHRRSKNLLGDQVLERIIEADCSHHLSP